MTAPYDDRNDWRDGISRALSNVDKVSTRSIFHELNPHLEDSPIVDVAPDSYRAAAVLIPIIDRPNDPTVLLTLRSNDMPSHAGQISFPGGRVHPEDLDRIDTALRETHEEVGIERGHIEVLGDMGVHIGGRGYAVTPVVGVVHPDADHEPCPREVQEIFEVPLSFLFDRQNYVIETRKNSGVEYRMPAIPFERYHIWGLTAGIIHSFARTVCGWTLDGRG